MNNLLFILSISELEISKDKCFVIHYTAEEIHSVGLCFSLLCTHVSLAVISLLETKKKTSGWGSKVFLLE